MKKLEMKIYKEYLSPEMAKMLDALGRDYLKEGEEITIIRHDMAKETLKNTGKALVHTIEPHFLED